MSIEHHFRHLGKPCRDKVTEFEGVAESVCFDLYGCILIMLRPAGLTKDGESKRGEWFDEKRIEALGDSCIIPPPNFFTIPIYAPPGPAVHVDTRRKL